ncbi:MAG TPA: MBL fold metallo-hydrolase [Pirellulaceae bacterium]|nr:MBL fold metallo-hydrolase [Pirellulaceae bacterium]
MPRNLHTIRFPGEMILLGTGTSVGVPSIGCGCPVCTGGHPRNQRTRCAAILGLPEGNLLIDTPPDLRQQLVREGIGIVHAVAYTHEHADHIFGMDDLRLFQFYLGHAVPLYCRSVVEQKLRQAFDYAFADIEPTHVGATPRLEFRPIDVAPFSVLGSVVTPIPLEHGPRFEVLGFRIGNVAYCTDCNRIPDASRPLLEGLDTLVLDGLRNTPHVTHFNVEQAVEEAKRIGAARTYLTHCSCELDYETTNRSLPPGIDLGYDGLRIPLT